MSVDYSKGVAEVKLVPRIDYAEMAKRQQEGGRALPFGGHKAGKARVKARWATELRARPTFLGSGALYSGTRNCNQDEATTLGYKQVKFSGVSLKHLFDGLLETQQQQAAMSASDSSHPQLPFWKHTASLT